MEALNLEDVLNMPTLREGAEGDSVLKLQKHLKAFGFYSRNACGTFTEHTKEAVMAFQRANLLEADGIVGAQTWKAIVGVYTQCSERVVMTKQSTHPSGHIVQYGENLHMIAHNLGLEPDALRELNMLDTNILHVGQKITIPPKDSTVYTVQHGDCLLTIANKFGVTPEEIRSRNRLMGNEIHVGQMLVIGR